MLDSCFIKVLLQLRKWSYCKVLVEASIKKNLSYSKRWNFSSIDYHKLSKKKQVTFKDPIVQFSTSCLVIPTRLYSLLLVRKLQDIRMSLLGINNIMNYWWFYDNSFLQSGNFWTVLLGNCWSYHIFIHVDFAGIGIQNVEGVSWKKNVVLYFC